MDLSFDNTEIAFKHKTTKELQKARRLFGMFNNKFLVEQGPKLASLGLTMGLPIKGMIKNTIFDQFCGGEDIESSYPYAKKLNDNGIGAILDFSVEGEGNEKSYQRAFEQIQQVILYAAGKPGFPFAVFKCTGLGPIELMEKKSAGEKFTRDEEILYQTYIGRVDHLCHLAKENHVRLFIDAEESWIQPAIDDLTYSLMAKYNQEECIVFNTIQLYRKNQIGEIEHQISTARTKGYNIGFKLVRGAYMEKEAERAKTMGYPNPIQDSKEATDTDYNIALRLCFKNRDITQISAGTHNEESCYLLAQLIAEHDVPKNDQRFWFAQLYGMSDHISYNLAADGYNVAKYLPYGPVKDVLPYLARRAKENSSVKGQVGRELRLISKEIIRRRENR